MTIATATRTTFVEALNQEVGLSRNECAELLEDFLRAISDCLAEGETVKISNFGSFFVRHKGTRMGRNPKTGDSVALAGKYVPHFKPGKDLRERVNGSRGIPVRN